MPADPDELTAARQRIRRATTRLADAANERDAAVVAGRALELPLSVLAEDAKLSKQGVANLIQRVG